MSSGERNLLDKKKKVKKLFWKNKQNLVKVQYLTFKKLVNHSKKLWLNIEIIFSSLKYNKLIEKKYCEGNYEKYNKK